MKNISVGDKIWTWYDGAEQFEVVNVFKYKIWLRSKGVTLCRSECDIFLTEKETIEEATR